MRLFRRMRANMLNDNRVGRYLAYAAGEIILVVIGILLAMQINNWNTGRTYKAQTNEILRTVVEDLKDDTTEIGLVIRNYSAREKVYKTILNQEATDSHYTSNVLYRLLITTIVPFTLEKRGYNQLMTHKGAVNMNEDTLVTQFLVEMGMLHDNISRNKQLITEDVFSTINQWKTEHSWFWKISSREFTPEWLDYVVKSDDYKSKVAFHRELIYGNHLPYLKAFQQSSSNYLTAINERLKNED